MKNLISLKQATVIIIVLLTVMLIFHTLVLTQIIPYAIIWAGKISSVKEMCKLEVLSISVNSLVILILLLKAGYIQNKIPSKILNKIIWLFALLFSLNTIGNLFAKSQFELYVFSPLTFILAVLCLRIVIDKNPQAPIKNFKSRNHA
jgi:uncharacterized membrane protein